MLKDSQQRAQAIDPHQSFIVQAPAGSGKTEILTQRYLRLLSTVTTPEQIVALTFTRKAASEMRERILRALNQANLGENPASLHQQQTYRYAQEALTQSKALNWNLLENTGRLRIITLDALCQTLSHAIPLQEMQIPYAQVSNNPLIHYQAAARQCLEHALEQEALHTPLMQLLKHLDNRQDWLLELLSDMLNNRSQWLDSFYSAREQSKDHYEHMLALIEHHELTRFKDSIPFVLRHELCQIVQKFSLIETPYSASYQSLRNWNSFDQINRELSHHLACLLLTSQHNLRKSFDHHVGLKRGVCPDDLYDELKNRSQKLFSQLDSNPAFLDALLKVRNLPLPYYNPSQWAILQALFTFLPLLMGHLHLIFSEQNEVDFTAISQFALNALGSEDQPTDLTLYLDHAIHHILVDEFQDTSIQQFQLLTQLVQGWQPHERKTLFVVGDPMQSIYRFRQAEVGLFLKAKHQGIGPIPLVFLELCCNFRSTATLVNWVNDQFHFIFPKTDDMESGAISFHESTSALPQGEIQNIQAFQLNDRQHEAQVLAQLASQELQRYPQDTIAILVRSRHQLSHILDFLRKNNIPFQGMEIELLAKFPHLRDIFSLTQSLLKPANRLALLEVLRSPFCGLSLIDLHLIANFDKKKSIYYALQHLDQIHELSEDGRSRAQFVFTVLEIALANRHHQPPVDWIMQTFRQLQGDKIFDTTQRAELEPFWMLLERATQEGQYPDLKQMKNELNQLYSQRVHASRLHIMTIHKAKGLEFDCVILPGLSAKSRGSNKPFLRFLKLPSEQHQELLLVSPIKAADQQHCLLYDYLETLDEEKNHYETQRLLYVAVTRAKKRLYLLDNSDKESKGTFRNLLKKQEFTIPTPCELVEEHSSPTLPQLYRLPSEFYTPLLTTPCYQNKPSTINPQNHHARQLGIVTHELLQWICEHHPTTLDALPWAYVMNQLKGLGLDEKACSLAHATLYQQIKRFLNDPMGQWICDAHLEERSEYALLMNEHDTISTRIIDRTFLYQNQRWIIDFKTGQDDENTQTAHRQQVNEYAQLFTSRSSHLIMCGVYYLTDGHWIEWPYSA